MIKNILIILIIFFSLFSNIYAYDFSEKDEKLLNKFYKIIDKKFSKKIKAKKLYLQIKKIKTKFLVKKSNKKYKKKIRIYFLLNALEKYLANKLNISYKNSQKNYISEKNNFNKKKSFINSGNNLINPENIKKVKNEQDEQKIIIDLKKTNFTKNKINKNISKNKKLEITNFTKNKINKNILKTTKNNGVVVNYVSTKKQKIKKQEKIIKNKYLVSEIIDFNKLKIRKNIIHIISLGDFECNNKDVKKYFIKKIKNKKVGLDGLKKINGKITAELYLDGKNIGEFLTENDICKFR